MSFLKLQDFPVYLIKAIFDIIYLLHFERMIISSQQNISNFYLEFVLQQYNLVLQRYVLFFSFDHHFVLNSH